MDVREELKRWIATVVQMSAEEESKVIKQDIDLFLSVAGELSGQLAERNTALAKQIRPRSASASAPKPSKPASQKAQKQPETSPGSDDIPAIWIAGLIVLIVIVVQADGDKGAYAEASAPEEIDHAEMCYESVDAKKWQDAWSSCAVSSERGDAGSQNNIGYMYEYGHGVPKNPSEAVNWYRKAAGQGDAVAQNNLAIAYEYGTGVTRDLDQAIVWYKKAADQGHEGARKRIASLQNENINKIEPNKIPNDFHGEWNEDLTACGTDYNDSKLIISETLLSFWESDASVKSVKMNNPRSVTVFANYAGEGQAWSNTITLNLSRSERELVIDGFTRYRCS